MDVSGERLVSMERLVDELRGLPRPKFTDVSAYMESEVCPALREALRAGEVVLIDRAKLPAPFMWHGGRAIWFLDGKEQQSAWDKLSKLLCTRRKKALIDLLKGLETAFVRIVDCRILACRGEWLKETVSRPPGQVHLVMGLIELTYSLVPSEVAESLRGAAR